MADTITEISSPPLHNSKNITSNNISIWCYVLIIVGTGSVILGVINLFLVKWCAHRRLRRSAGGEAAAADGSGKIENPACLVSFKYRKGKGSAAADQECCVICLSGFHEGEEVRRLSRCNHLFHAPCIDMWLFSHSDCPLCRTPVKPVLCHTVVNVSSVSENSRDGLLDPLSLP